MLKNIVAVFMLLIFTLAVFAADWPQFRGPDHTGISTETGINKQWNTKKPKLLWKMPMTDNGYGGPAVANNVLYIMDHKDQNDIIRAMNATTGKQAWAYAFNDGSRDNYGFTRATPSVDGTNVYALSKMGKLFSVKITTGKLNWWTDLISIYKGKIPGWEYSFSPCVDGNKIIVSPGASNSHTIALDKSNAKLLWRTNTTYLTGYSTAVPATINGVSQYIVFAGDALLGISTSDGKLIWKFSWKTGCDVNAASPLIISNNRIFITSGYGHGCAMVEVNGSSAKAIWENKSMQAHFSSPVFYKGFIFGNTDPGKLICLDPATGKTLWSKDGFEKGGLMAIENTLICAVGNTGDVVMVDANGTTYKELGRFSPLGNGEMWAAPIVANGKLYVRNKVALGCFDLK
jgi:outer membrane protein assembly factor BamB